jgi:polyhydroxyalkanoate synthase
MQKDAPVPVGEPPEAVESRPKDFDQPFHTAIVRLSGGLSPLALSQAYTDWAQHLLLSPDKQAELTHKAVQKGQRLLSYCTRAPVASDCPICIEPLPQDKRFVGEAWQRWPFNALYQSFLLTQQWWHNAVTVSQACRDIMRKLHPVSCARCSTSSHRGGGQGLCAAR